MPTAIKVENLSKAYQLGQIGTGTISRDLERYWAKLRGKEDPFLRIGETTASASASKNDIVWSLKDINFEINQGDAVGIIGRNGAGKSTLLKILSRVTAPTTGSVKVKGRIASLLEVGTGFHPELSGRENIFLNGAILGMRKAEIKKHFDAIVDFAGVERYIDTPVKRYSSGMYVRLAFAVAAHLESEILVVDEVLAVGDAEFQKKCLGKMGDLSKGEGRTVLFVSHNIGAVKQLCTKGILLQNGQIICNAKIDNIIQHYITSFKTENKLLLNHKSTKDIKLLGCELMNTPVTGMKFAIKLKFKSVLETKTPHISIIIKDEHLNIVTTFYSFHSTKNNLKMACGENNIICEIQKLPLCIGEYLIDIWISINGYETIDFLENVLKFSIQEDLYFNSGFISEKTKHGFINIENNWLNA